MKILIIGSGAREHAIAKALHRSKQEPILYCCGTTHNPGIRELTSDYWVGDICNVDDVTAIAKKWQIEMAIIGPEAPLAHGLANALSSQSIGVIGPTKDLAQIETSKAFARNLLSKYRIPGAPQYRIFHDLSGTKEFLQQLGNNQYVIKSDGLAGGKGVKVAGDHLHSLAEAYAYCQELVKQQQSFVIEEKLIGPEFSLICFTDGEHVIPMPAVQDHKRAYEGNSGPNTGGMGSYSDSNHRLPFLSENEIETALLINKLTLNALRAECNENYIGFLYGGFMVTHAGVKVIEFNARLGDPEALNILALLESDFVTICAAMVAGNLTPQLVKFAKLATVCKYAVPEGYPDKPLKNTLIDVSDVKNSDQLYLAGINMLDGKLYATGSRAAAVVGVAANIASAELIAEAEISRIKGKLYHRKDIGKHAPSLPPFEV